MPDRSRIFSRRRLLGAGLAAGGALLAGGAGLLALRGAAPAVPGLRCLSPHEHRTVRALAEALYPRGGSFPQGAADFGLATAFDGFLADEPPWNQGDLKKGLLLLELGPVLFDHRLTTFSNLDEAARLAHFRSWGEGGDLLRRQVATALRKFLALVFYDQPPLWAQIGYDGPQVKADSRGDAK